MYHTDYNLSTIMTGSIIMGAFVLWLFSKFAKRDSDLWDKSYESKGAKTTRIVLMCILGLYAITPFIRLLFGWNSIRDNQKVSFASSIMLGISLFYYELRFRQSPRSVWVKIRKVIAYILISVLYIGVWPTTLLQFTTGQISGVYGDAWGTILGANTLIYGISILIIWLLLKHYNSDKLISYSQKNNKEVPPVIETPSNISKRCEEQGVANQEATILEQDNPTPEETRDDNTIHTAIDTSQKNRQWKLPNTTTKDKLKKNKYFEEPKTVLKWIVGIFVFVALAIGGIILGNYLHDIYIPEKRLERTMYRIIQKFNSEDTRVEYAHYILQKKHDWGCKNFYYKYNGWYTTNEYISSKLQRLYGEDALKVIENKAYQGDAKCQFDLGTIYYLDYYSDDYPIFNSDPYKKYPYEKYQKDYNRNQDKAAYWWLESAKSGYIRAFYYIGMCYKHGFGVNRDMNKATEWLQLGAEAGEPWAQKNYGDLFINSDIEQAKYWWKKSAAQGNEDAKERLQKIYL